MVNVESITIGTDSYSVYGSEADVKTRLSGRLGTTVYDDASSNDKKKAHVQATRWIDRERWSGQPTDLVTPQPLAYPRTGLTDCDGNAVDSGTLPDEVFFATSELILILLGDNTATSSSSTGTNTKRVAAGSVNVEFFRPGASDGTGGGTTLPTEAWKWVRCFASGGLSAPFASGTGADPFFTDCDKYDLWTGYP